MGAERGRHPRCELLSSDVVEGGVLLLRSKRMAELEAGISGIFFAALAFERQ
jgi:hypothetical protein